MKVVKIDGENFHIFWMTWGISMKFSGIMSLMIILKVTKKTEIYLPSRRYIFRKTTVGVKLTNQIRFNDSFTEKPHTVCSKFLWPFSTFNFFNLGWGLKLLDLSCLDPISVLSLLFCLQITNRKLQKLSLLV